MNRPKICESNNRSYNLCVYHERYMLDMALFLIGPFEGCRPELFQTSRFAISVSSHGLYNMVEHERESWYG